MTSPEASPRLAGWNVRWVAGSLFLLATLLFASCGLAQSVSKGKLSPAQQLDKDVEYIRDPATGELRVVPRHSLPGSAPASNAPTGGSVIRSRVRLVEIGCTALSAQGEPLRDLLRDDFRLSADGAPQSLVHLDTSTEPAHLVLLIDASPSEFHALSEMKSAARALASELSPRDEVAVVAFAGHPHFLLPFSTDRKQLEAALGRVELLRATEETGSAVYGSLFLVAQRLFTGPHAPSGRKAILLLTDGQDSGLGLSWIPRSLFPANGAAQNRLTFEDVVRQLATSGIETHIISTENRPSGMTKAWLGAHSRETLVSDASRNLNIPAYTIFLAELIRRAGGGLYFLHEAGTLTEAYRRIAAALRTEYTLGFYPDTAAGSRGWHAVGVIFSRPTEHPGAKLDCRPSYFVPASQ
jgi:VWFA-related protein